MTTTPKHKSRLKMSPVPQESDSAHSADSLQPQRPLTHPEVRTIVIGIMLALFLGALDQTIVATALPTIGVHFGNIGDLSWVVTAYLLTSTAVTPLYGKLSDIYGRRNVMLAAIIIFIVGSIACALAPSLIALSMSRALQGLGGGGLMALVQTIIADIVSPRERGRYQGYIGAVFAASSIGGPVLGGILTEAFDWSLIFWINVPLGLLALGMSVNVLRRIPFHARVHRLDFTGAVLMMSAAVALLLALSWGGRVYAWMSPQISALVAISSLLWGLFAWRIARAAEPFLPLAVLTNPVVRSAALAGACGMSVLVGMTIYVPIFFEAVLHLSAGQSGLALIPLMGATVVWSTITGRLMMHMTHYKRVPLVGLSITLVALLVFASLTDPSVLTVLILLFFVGSGLGTVFPVSTVCLQNAVARHQMGIATGVSHFFRALFSSLVVAALGAIVLGNLGGPTGTVVEALARNVPAPEITHAFHFVFLACAVVVAFGIAFLIAMEQRPLKGPALHSESASATTTP